MSEYSGGGNYYGDAVDFEIVDRDVAGLVIKAIPGLTLSGVVVADELTTRELLALLPELRVHAYPETPAPTQATGSGNAVVAADGTFQIMGLRPGRLRVDVSSNVRGAHDQPLRALSAKASPLTELLKCSNRCRELSLWLAMEPDRFAER